MPGSVLLSAASALRVASLNLCTDEYLLLLARPSEIVSVSHLSHDPLESPLWRQARRHSANAGTLESVVAARPNLVLTMGSGGRASAAIAKRLGIKLVELPFPASVDDVEKQTLNIASALGNRRRAEPFVLRLAELRRSRLTALQDGAYLGGGGLTLAPGSLGADWLKLAGIGQRATANGRISLETLATAPPKWLFRSDYRSRQVSRGQDWLKHPLVRRLAPRTVATDGRLWTCAGLPMIPEIQRLRARVR